MKAHSAATVAVETARESTEAMSTPVVVGADWPALRVLGPLLAVLSAAALSTGVDDVRAPALLFFLVGLGMASLGRERRD